MTTLLALTVIANSMQERSKIGSQTVAILPWSVSGGNQTAKQTLRKTVRAMFERCGLNVEIGPRPNQIWSEDLHYKSRDWDRKGDEWSDLPSAQDLLALGDRMGVDLVCAGRAKWHTKTIWVTLGPKTKSDCTVDVIVVDVKRREISLEARDINADSTKVETALETAGGVLVSLGIPLFSAGPETPHQQRAAANAVAEAMEPWMKSVVHHERRIGIGH